MPVYCDPLMTWPVTPKWKYGAVSHLYADSAQELHEFALAIGMRRHWCSDVTQPGSVLLHYDLSPSMRAKAVNAGAREVPYAHMTDYKRSLDVRKREVAEAEARRPARRRK